MDSGTCMNLRKHEEGRGHDMKGKKQSKAKWKMLVLSQSTYS